MKKILTRRVFISSALVTGTILMLMPQGSKTPIKIDYFRVINSVQNILFPKNRDAPSANDFGATAYLINVSSHPSFLKDDLLFLYRGSRELIEKNPNFLKMGFVDKSKAIDNFSKTDMGENWLSMLLYYTIEAMLSDPIYGGNINEIGWRWLNHHTGKPQPKKPFGEKIT